MIRTICRHCGQLVSTCFDIYCDDCLDTKPRPHRATERQAPQVWWW